MGFLKNLFRRDDPLDQQANNLVVSCQIWTTGLFVPLIKEFEFLKQSDPQDWNFFTTIASVYVASQRLRSEVSAGRFKPLFQIVLDHVRKLDHKGEIALADCQNFMKRNCEKDIADQNFTMLGLWVLLNLLQRQPTREEMNASYGIGRMLAEPLSDWWESK